MYSSMWKIWKIRIIHYMPKKNETDFIGAKSCTWLCDEKFASLKLAYTKEHHGHPQSHGCRVPICGGANAAGLAQDAAGGGRGGPGGRVRSEQWVVGPRDRVWREQGSLE